MATPVFLAGESCGERSMRGYSPWGREESDTTEQLKRSNRNSRQLRGGGGSSGFSSCVGAPMGRGWCDWCNPRGLSQDAPGGLGRTRQGLGEQTIDELRKERAERGHPTGLSRGRPLPEPTPGPHAASALGGAQMTRRTECAWPCQRRPCHPGSPGLSPLSTGSKST